jgi:hypothetical protein
MQAMRIFGLAIAVAAVVSLMSVSQASAQPVAGATYTGEITGCAEPPCGTVHFTVSGDGSQVQGFTAYDVPGDVCEFQSANPFPIPLDIVGDSFGPGIPGLYEVSGSFPSEGSAEGTLRLVVDEPPCDSGVLDWTATASFPTPTPPPVGGIAELPDVSGSSAPNYLALAGLAAAALVTLVAGGWYASGRRPR